MVVFVHPCRFWFFLYFLRYGWIQELQKTLAMADGVKENNMTGDEKEIFTTSTRTDVRQDSSRKKWHYKSGLYALGLFEIECAQTCFLQCLITSTF